MHLTLWLGPTVLVTLQVGVAVVPYVSSQHVLCVGRFTILYTLTQLLRLLAWS